MRNTKSGKSNSMTDIKIIKTKEDYEAALKLIEQLMIADPNPDSDEGEKLGLLATLVRDYETKVFPEFLPNPIEAIKFRMEQANLKPADLIPYIGSRSRVSEILSGKRKLTVDMMRALEAGLGIPAKILLKEPEKNEDFLFKNWSRKVLKTMSDRGYFGNKKITIQNEGELLTNFFSTVGNPLQLQVMLRSSVYRSAPNIDKRALAGWTAKILNKAKESRITTQYKEGSVDLEFMQRFVKLSVKDNSPLIAQEELKKHGIALVVEPHLPGTHLDGATIMTIKKRPVIGLTLRHDRLDNFWFTLMHELAHIALHFQEGASFYDELDDPKGLEPNPKEKEADHLASEALIPNSKWEVSPARLVPSSMAASSLAKELGVHIAIVAGKIRHEGKKFTYLSSIVGEAKVQKFFPGNQWD